MDQHMIETLEEGTDFITTQQLIFHERQYSLGSHVVTLTQGACFQSMKKKMNFSAVWLGAEHPPSNGAGEHRFCAAKAQRIRRNSPY
jgi:hypothetical protein